jgi:mono/diheme cytochrome c family protein
MGGKLRTRLAWGFVALVVAAFSALLIVLVASNATDDAKVGGSKASLTAAERHGSELFAKTCSTCHSLKASNAVGKVGPNLDYVQPTVDQTRAVIAQGLQGSQASMPPGLLTGPDSSDVALYLARVADRSVVGGR